MIMEKLKEDVKSIDEIIDRFRYKTSNEQLDHTLQE